MNLLEKFKPIKAFVLDMDGVLTDGTLLVMPDGEWVRKMHIRDGYVLQLAINKGYKVCVITGSWSKAVRDRLIQLGITDVFEKVANKEECMTAYMKDKGLAREEVLYMGDDMPDLGVMQLAGLGCCPADAVVDIREIAHYISPENGGYGCVRDVIEKVLRLNNHWNNADGIRSL